MTLRYGIIGTGMMGCEHIRNIVNMDGVEITAVADPNEKPRRWALKACGDRFSPRVHEDYRELLDSKVADLNNKMEDDVKIILACVYYWKFPQSSHVHCFI